MECAKMKEEGKKCEIPCGEGICSKVPDWGEAIKIQLDMVVTKEGQCHSRHFPATEIDRNRLLSLSGGGMGYVAHILLIEALKREAFLGYFSLKTKEGLEGKIYDILNQIIIKELPKIIENLNIEGINGSPE